MYRTKNPPTQFIKRPITRTKKPKYKIVYKYIEDIKQVFPVKVYEYVDPRQSQKTFRVNPKPQKRFYSSL